MLQTILHKPILLSNHIAYCAPIDAKDAKEIEPTTSLFLPAKTTYGCHRETRLKAEQSICKIQKIIQTIFTPTAFLRGLVTDKEGKLFDELFIFNACFFGVPSVLFGAVYAVTRAVELMVASVPYAMREIKRLQIENERPLQKNLPPPSQWKDLRKLTQPGCLELMWEDGLLPKEVLAQAFEKRALLAALHNEMKSRIETPKTLNDFERVDHEIQENKKKQCTIRYEWRKLYTDYLENLKESIPAKYDAIRQERVLQKYNKAAEALLNASNSSPVKSRMDLQKTQLKMQKLAWQRDWELSHLGPLKKEQLLTIINGVF